MTTVPIPVPETGEHAPIRTFADILRALSRDPALAEALRQHILGDELRRLPAAFQRLAATVEEYMTQTNRILAELRAGQARQDADIAEVKADITEIKAKFLPFDARKMIGVIAGRLNIRRPVWLDNTDLLEIADAAGDLADAVPDNELQISTLSTWRCGRLARPSAMPSMWSLNVPTPLTETTFAVSGATLI